MDVSVVGEADGCPREFDKQYDKQNRFPSIIVVKPPGENVTNQTMQPPLKRIPISILTQCGVPPINIQSYANFDQISCREIIFIFQPRRFIKQLYRLLQYTLYSPVHGIIGFSMRSSLAIRFAFLNCEVCSLKIVFTCSRITNPF